MVDLVFGATIAIIFLLWLFYQFYCGISRARAKTTEEGILRKYE